MFDLVKKPQWMLPIALIASIPILYVVKVKEWKEWEESKNRDFYIWLAYWRENHPNNDATDDDLNEMFVRLRGLPGSKGYRQFKKTIINIENKNNRNTQ